MSWSRRARPTSGATTRSVPSARRWPGSTGRCGWRCSRPGCRSVTFAGSLGLEPRAHEAGPGAVNAAVFNLMRQISLLYGPRGVTTHTLSPGPADTPRLRRIVAAVAAERGADERDVWQ